MVAKWMRDGNQAYDQATIGELKTFVRDQRGTHVTYHGSPGDDCVMALGLTLAACRYAEDNNLAEPKLSHEGSIAWWEKRLSRPNGKKRLSPTF